MAAPNHQTRFAAPAPGAPSGAPPFPQAGFSSVEIRRPKNPRRPPESGSRDIVIPERSTVTWQARLLFRLLAFHISVVLLAELFVVGLKTVARLLR